MLAPDKHRPVLNNKEKLVTNSLPQNSLQREGSVRKIVPSYQDTVYFIMVPINRGMWIRTIGENAICHLKSYAHGRTAFRRLYAGTLRPCGSIVQIRTYSVFCHMGPHMQHCISEILECLHIQNLMKHGFIWRKPLYALSPYGGTVRYEPLWLLYYMCIRAYLFWHTQSFDKPGKYTIGVSQVRL